MIERFQKKSDFDKFWAENEFSNLYNHHLERTCKVGSEDTFRCKFYSKSGYKKCRMQAKVIFPGCDDSAELFITDDSHQHERLVMDDVNGKATKFTWKRFPEAEELVINGLKHNDFPTQIMKSLDEAGIPLPSYQQLNNKIAYLRRILDMHGDIATSGELEAAINKHTKVPEDEHEPFVKDYKTYTIQAPIL